ncbi:MAG: hypothetical protein AB8B61_07615 [Cyclobacteriaceae bacterium]
MKISIKVFASLFVRANIIWGSQCFGNDIPVSGVTVNLEKTLRAITRKWQG